MKYYTYAHSKPDGTIFYIGKGHSKRAYDLVKRNIYWKRVVEKHGTPTVKILANWATEQEALDHEVLLISCFKEMGYKLTNLTDGGEGSSGFKHSQESIEKISKVKKANPTRYWLGKPRNLETNKKISKALLGKPSKSGNQKGLVIATNIETGKQITLDGRKNIESYGFSSGHVSKCLLGERKTHKNHTFKRITP